MGVYKEEAYVFEDIARRQKRIYPDACDVGVRINSPKDPLALSVKDALKGLEGLKQKRTSWGEPTDSCRGVEVTVRIPWEMEDGFYFGTEYRIAYHQDKSRNIYFISVDTDSFRSKESPFVD